MSGQTNLRDDPDLKALVKAAKGEREQTPMTLWDIYWSDPDDNLLRARRRCERQIEDGVNPRERRLLEGELAIIRYVKLVRWALRLRYGAHRFGTNSWDRYYRFDERPSFDLAREMDRRRADLGQRHIVDWTFKTVTTLGRPVLATAADGRNG